MSKDFDFDRDDAEREIRRRLVAAARREASDKDIPKPVGEVRARGRAKFNRPPPADILTRDCRNPLCEMQAPLTQDYCKACSDPQVVERVEKLLNVRSKKEAAKRSLHDEFYKEHKGAFS